MANDEGENKGDAQIPEAELEKDLDVSAIDTIDPENATPEQVTDLVKKSKTLAAQRKHWQTKAIDPVTGKPYRDLVVKPAAHDRSQDNNSPSEKKDEDKAVSGRLERLEESDEKRNFGHEHTLSPRETDHVFAYAKTVGKKPADVLGDSFLKGGLAAIRSEARTDGAIPGPSNRSPRVDGKSFAEMDPKDREKNFGNVVAGLQRNTRR